ncbi:leucine-rich repeat domain-containing protein [Candidatus Uabimicrobium sp. HlEnr_7]|uniref:leucine-rich repeat domain-containing protein n=1 Tax=Candidatus Uabimicrobium helgolandensis TaxID=3095367 RepID=UPI0035571B25
MAQKVVKSKVLTTMESNTNYFGCTFYLKNYVELENSCFDNCSFRSKVDLYAKHLKFHNCSFSDVFTLIVDEWNSDAIIEDIQQYRSATAIYSGYLDYLPKELTELKNLTTISLRKSFIQTLPREIGQLQKLRYLNLLCNPLKNLPREIGQLQNLRYLNLYGYSLRKLPKEIWQLRNLRCLNLSGNNELRRLPQGIEQLENITDLYLPRNLRKIPKEISKLPKIKYLHICGYPVTKIPEEIRNMKGLFIEKKCPAVIDIKTHGSSYKKERISNFKKKFSPK